MSPAASRFRTWDDYFIPGTRVLQNRFTSSAHPYGVPDQGILEALEHGVTQTRLVELGRDPIPGPMNYDHMKAIHRHIFQDVYEWAGQERVAPTEGPMTKDGHAYYPAGSALTARAEELYGQLAAKDELRGLPREQFIPELGEIWGELNVVHSFREGNTRSQFAFFNQLTEQAGYTLHTEQFRIGGPLREEFVQARYECQDTGSTTRLAAVLNRGIDGGGRPKQTLGGPTPPGGTPPRSDLRNQIKGLAGHLQAQHDSLPRPTDLTRRRSGPTR